VSQIGEIAQTIGWRGAINHKVAEPSSVHNIPVIDNSNQFSTNVRTSVDCYVSGQYVQRNGKTFEITQRYTIYVAYNKENQMATMAQVRSRIVSDFESKYGKTFTVTNVYVPPVPIPIDQVTPGVQPGTDIPIEFYRGTDAFRSMTKYEKLRWDVGTERVKAETNIQSIRKRYKLGR
jgi:hypothetical protein